MNPLFQTALKQFESDGLVPRFPDDLPALVDLHAMAERFTMAKPTPEFLALLEPVARVGNVVLSRPSLGMVDFIASRLPEWCPDPIDHLRALAWCLAHAREPDVAWRLNDRAEFRATVKAWCRGVKATLSEIAAALEDFQRLEKSDEEQAATARKAGRPDCGWMIERMMSEYGGTVEEWLWRTPLESIRMLLRNLATRKAAENGHQGAPDPDLPGIQELAAFRTAEERLRATMKGRAHGK